MLHQVMYMNCWSFYLRHVTCTDCWSFYSCPVRWCTSIVFSHATRGDVHELLELLFMPCHVRRLLEFLFIRGHVHGLLEFHVHGLLEF